MDIDDLDPDHPDFDKDIKFGSSLLYSDTGMDVFSKLREQGSTFAFGEYGSGGALQKALRNMNDFHFVLPEKGLTGLGDATLRFRELSDYKPPLGQYVGFVAGQFSNLGLEKQLGNVGIGRLLDDIVAKNVIDGIDAFALGGASESGFAGLSQSIADALQDNSGIRFRRSLDSISEIAANTGIGQLSNTGIPVSRSCMRGMIGQGLASLQSQTVRDSFEDSEVLDGFIEEFEKAESEAEEMEIRLPETLDRESLCKLDKETLLTVVGYLYGATVVLRTAYAVESVNLDRTLTREEVEGWLTVAGGLLELLLLVLGDKNRDR
jgi:hypothetical protein